VEDVILHEQEGEAFLLHVPTGRYFGLNEAGLVVWKALIAGDDPVQELGRRWPGVPSEERQADTAALLDALVRAGLAQPATGPPTAATS
jgi:hypothetical protein